MIGEIGAVPVSVPGNEEESLPARGSLGMENGGEVPVPGNNEVTFDAVTGETGVVAEDELESVEDEVVSVVVNVNGSVIVVCPVLRGAVGAVFHLEVSLHGVGNAGEDDSESVIGLPSVDELAPEGIGK